MSHALLVDDSELVRLTFGAVLEDAGFCVRNAESLAGARRVLAEGGDFDLVVLDLELGDGSGLDLVPEVRAVRPTAAIVLLTGTPLDTPPPGVDGVLRKADGPEQQLAAVAAARARCGAAHAARRPGRGEP
jgi:DNA-binding response OmpR family regulator